MNQHSLHDTLRESVEGIPLDGPPLGEIHRQATRKHRARLLGLSLTVAVCTVLAAAAAPRLLSADADLPVLAETEASNSPAPTPSIPSRSDLGPDGLPNGARLSDQPWTGDGSSLVDGLTQLKDCPDALQFFQRPDVEKYYAENFGRAFGPEDVFAGGCPDVQALERQFDAAH